MWSLGWGCDSLTIYGMWPLLEGSKSYCEYGGPNGWKRRSDISDVLLGDESSLADLFLCFDPLHLNANLSSDAISEHSEI